MEDLSTSMIQKKSPLVEAIECLKESPYYLWITLCIKFTSFAAFSVMAVCSSVYLTEEQKFSEKEAGLIFASFGVIISVYSVVLSNLAKIIGIRSTLTLGNLMGFIGYISILFVKDKFFQYLIILFFIMLAISINLTNTKLGVKYYTYPKSRSLAYTIYYLVFFIAAGFASGTVDFFTAFYQHSGYLYQILFSFGAGLYATTMTLSLFLKDIDLENGEDTEYISMMPFKEVMKLTRFKKFMVFIGLMLVVKSVYFHVSGTLPIYMLRTVDGGKHFGLMMVIHQVLLLIMTPFCSYLVFYFDKYTILVVGTFFTSVSPMALYYFDSYFGVIAFIVVISIGESIYAPRLVDYSVEIAPEGAEAVFLGIAAVTNSLPLIITGLTGAFLMASYCTIDSPTTCFNIWFWISLYSLSAVFIMMTLRNFIEVKPYKLNAKYTS